MIADTVIQMIQHIHYALHVQDSNIEDAILHGLSLGFQYVILPVQEPLPVISDDVARLLVHCIPRHHNTVEISRFLAWCTFYNFPTVMVSETFRNIGNFPHTPLVIDASSWEEYDEVRQNTTASAFADVSEDPRWEAENVEFIKYKPETNFQHFLRLGAVVVVEDASQLHCLGREIEHTEFPDLVQTPLQPLAENLPSTVYQVFERDRAKYVAYGEAVRLWLSDHRPATRNEAVTVVVAGAGRGGIVNAILDVIGNLKVRLIALEKNPFALDILAHRQKNESRWKFVEVEAGDMREVKFSFQVDLLVTELLGSFGCNEASPECITGFLAHHCGAESIPQSYTSFVAPVSCRDVWAAVSRKDALYVVNFARYLLLDKEQAVWTFNHTKDAVLVKGGKFQFENTKNAPVHGFAGFFEARLYQNIVIGNRQTSKSWFPCFFPLAEPVKGGVVVEIRRQVGENEVWYEWRGCDETGSRFQHNSKNQSISLVYSFWFFYISDSVTDTSRHYRDDSFF